MSAETQNPVRLLVIEDNFADVMLIQRILEQYCRIPIEITSAIDCEEAFSALEDNKGFDLVVLDLNLPKISGHAFLERHNTATPVVVFSSSLSEDDKERALALGAREFVRKPIQYDNYVNAVCGIVERWAESP